MIKKTTLALAISMLTGCAISPGFNHDSAAIDQQKVDKEGVPESVIQASLSGSENLPPIEYKPSDVDGYFSLSRMEQSDPLPDIPISILSLNNTSVYDSLRLLLLDLGINLSMSHQVASKTGMYMVHGEGRLPIMVDEIAKATDLFYTFKDNTLSFTDKETFVFKVPPMLDEEAEQDIIDTLVSLGIDSSAIDSRFNTVTFEATRKEFKPAKSYLKSISQAGSVIVFDTWIWEVALNNEHRSGVQWEQLNLGGGNTSLNLSGGVSSAVDSAANLVGAVAHTSNNLSASVLVNFLKSHGSLTTLSQPKISLISGSSAKMEVGEEVKYVSELTSTVSTSGDTTQSSATTETLSTGLKLDIYGAYEQETVYSKIGLDISDLLRFNEFTASGTVLSLPHTVIRKVETDTRIEPGDYFILGGVNMTRKQIDDSSTPGLFGQSWLTLPFYKNKSDNKSELVIVMRPRVIVFDEAPKAPEVDESEVVDIEPAATEKEPVESKSASDTDNSTDALEAKQ